MKYLIPLTRTESKEVEIFAPNRDDALSLALRENPQFKAEWVIEIENGEEKESHRVFEKCESCERVIWEGEEYVTDGEVCLCKACYAAQPEEKQ